MRRGTKVGQAYIAITADGSGINDEIADAFENIDTKEIGNKNGRDFQRALKKHLEAIETDFDRTFKRVGKRGAKTLSSDFEKAVTSDRAFDQFGTDLMNKMFNDGRMDPVMKRIGEKIGYRWGNALDKPLETAMRDSFRKSIQRASRDRSFDINKFLFGLSSDAGGKDIPVFGPMFQDMTKAAEKEFNAQTKAYADRNKEMRTQAQKIRRDLEKISRDFQKNQTKDAAKIHRTLQKLARDSREIIRKGEEEAAKAEEKENLRILKMKIESAKAEQSLRRAMHTEALKMNKEFNKARDRQIFLERQALNVTRSRIQATQTMTNLMAKRGRFQGLISAESLAETELELTRFGARRREIEFQITVEKDESKILAYRKELQKIAKDEEKILDSSGLRGRRAQREALARGRAGRDGSDGRTRPGAIFAPVFGAGSRNNVLNLLGRSVGRAINLVDTLGRTAVRTGTAFTKGFNAAAEGASGFQRTMAGVNEVGTQAATGISGALSNLAKSGPAAIAVIAVAVTTLIATMSVLVSVISALTALVVALASTITTALVGSVAVLGGVLATAAGAAGLLAIAFTSMTNSQKKALGEAFGPLREGLVGIGQAILKDVVPAFKTWAGNLKEALTLIGPVAEVMGKAFAESGNILTKALSGPGFSLFFEALEERLPSITIKMNQALAGIMNGFMGVFAAMMPHVERFAGYLADLGERFSDWASSAEGQNAIVDFMDRAFESIQSLWNATREFFGWLGDILFSREAQDAGNSMFDSLAESFRGFRETVAEMIENGDLQKWFDDARKFGGYLKEAMIGLKDLFNTLNSSGVLAAVGWTIGWIGRMFGSLAWQIDLVVGFFTGLVKAVAASLEWAWQPFQWAIEKVSAAFDQLIGPIRDAMAAVTETIGGAISAMIGWFADLVESVLDASEVIPNALSGLAKRVPVLGKYLSAGVDTVANGVTGSGRRAVDEMRRMQEGIENTFDGFARRMGTTGENAGHNFRTRILGAIGAVGQVATTRLSSSFGSIASMIGRAGALGGEAFYSNLISRVQAAVNALNRMTMGLFPKIDVGGTVGRIQNRISSMMRGFFVGGGAGGGGGLPKGWDDYAGAGRDALKDMGDKDKDKADKDGKDAADEWLNPYRAFAAGLINNGPPVIALLRKAMRDVNTQAAEAIREMAQATDRESVKTGLQELSKSMREAGNEMVSDAQDALNTAAQTLLNATSQAEATRAMRAVRTAQADLKTAKAQKKRVDDAARLLRRQEQVTNGSLTRLARNLRGLNIERATISHLNAFTRTLRLQNATLADFAFARGIVAEKLQEANARLVSAIQARDAYRTQIADSVKAFGSILSAEAKVVDGVTQALTANDIVDNLQDKFNQIHSFRQNMNRLLAMGLSQDAYRTLVEAGIEEGSAYAEALAKGGAGSIKDMNDLSKRINEAAGNLGAQASNRLYQAGVDTARGLVDGLTSLSGQLDAAATKLGKTISAAIAKELGIKSPSTKMIAMMDDLGDGGVLGMKAQERRWYDAAGALSSQIPRGMGAPYSAAMGGVSGNGGAGQSGTVQEHNWHIHTPTTDPEAVAREAINEVTARL